MPAAPPAGGPRGVAAPPAPYAAGATSHAPTERDARRIEEERWIGDEIYRDLGDLGLMGLYVPEQYGGQGLSQTGYARVFEAIGQVDGSLTVGMGVHQSIGMKGIVLFRSDEQKARVLPDLAARRKPAGLARAEANAGPDAAHARRAPRR